MHLWQIIRHLLNVHQYLWDNHGIRVYLPDLTLLLKTVREAVQGKHTTALVACTLPEIVNPTTIKSAFVTVRKKSLCLGPGVLFRVLGD